MADDPVRVPPEVYNGLEKLHKSEELNPDDRENAKQQASERGLDDTAKWLRQVDDEIYARAARGEFIAGGKE